MENTVDSADLDKFIIIGDRVLIKPTTASNQTRSGLYLPPGVREKEQTFSGYIVKTGPGYPVPALTDQDEPWKAKQEEVQYVPLQAREGDLAIYLQNQAFELKFNNEKYVIVPHNAILMLIRDEDLFD